MCSECGNPECRYGEWCDPYILDDEYLYQEQDGEDMFDEIPACESEVSMSKKVEIEVAKEDTKDKIIKKQTEVWVYDDEVYATYAKAVSAKLRSRVIELMVRKMYPSANKSNIEAYIRSWSHNPAGYTVYGSHVIEIVNTILEENMSEISAA